MNGDSFAVEYTPARGPRRRVRFVPRSDMPGFWRCTDEWNGCQWRETGREHVADVSTTDVESYLLEGETQ
jgi:hypothetical protein